MTNHVAGSLPRKMAEIPACSSPITSVHIYHDHEPQSFYNEKHAVLDNPAAIFDLKIGNMFLKLKVSNYGKENFSKMLPFENFLLYSSSSLKHIRQFCPVKNTIQQTALLGYMTVLLGCLVCLLKIMSDSAII